MICTDTGEPPEPIFEADSLPCSYGFCPRRRAQNAIEDLLLLITSGYLQNAVRSSHRNGYRLVADNRDLQYCPKSPPISRRLEEGCELGREVGLLGSGPL